MTTMFLSKEQQQILNDFGTAMDKMNQLLQNAQDLITKATKVSDATLDIMNRTEADKQAIKEKAREEILRLQKRIKTLENRQSYKKRKEQEKGPENFDV